MEQSCNVAYTVEVRYRTQSGCSSRTFRGVEAADITAAVERCVEKVRERRGVVKIDGGSAKLEQFRDGKRI
jgi:hypothetical protein